MQRLNFILTIGLIILLTSCSKEVKKESIIIEKKLGSQAIEAFNEGKKALEEGDSLFAAKKFNEVEILFPQSDLAPRSLLMAAYAYYFQDYYQDAVAELQRFLRVYPLHENIDYAYYLLAISYYEQIVDEKKDLQSIINAKENFDIVIKKFPNTDYALDAKFKIGLINDILASKEMYIGRYYFQKKKWIAAINRFRKVIDEYDTTIYAEEALHRLVEVYYKIGLVEEAEKYAILLGYNYQSSVWYEKTYSVFDKNYEISKNNKISQNKKKTGKILKKFKSLFE